MTLHEAMEVVLKENGQSMSSADIAKEINERNLYKKNDGSLIISYQIVGRAKNYPHLFNRSSTMISLK